MTTTETKAADLRMNERAWALADDACGKQRHAGPQQCGGGYLVTRDAIHSNSADMC